jgi:hypothetical protein
VNRSDHRRPAAERHSRQQEVGQSHRAIPALTALAFFGMRSGMKKLFVICLVFGVFGLSTKAEEKEQTEKSKLIHIAADVGEIARGSIELCEVEFPVLDAKFKSDRYNDLVARLRTPMQTAKSLPENLQKEFPGFFVSGHYDSVDAVVFRQLMCSTPWTEFYSQRLWPDPPRVKS